MVRITPASAGKSGLCSLPSVLHGDHPRECGEKCCPLCLHCQPIGSPPRVRGKVHSRKDSSVALWITPASAGKSDSVSPNAVLLKDHPRECGEKKPTRAPTSQVRGSPPRVRGKARWHRQRPCSKRITPASAGKRRLFPFREKHHWDHPRECGEKVVPSSKNHLIVGSPPRVRGKVKFAAVCALLPGITPASAGKRSKAGVASWNAWDHPRECGEK